MRSSGLTLFAGLLVACGPAVSGDNGGGDNLTPDAGPGGGGGGGGGGEFVDAAPAQQCTKMDIVFVVDDSGSMSEEQSNLATNFPEFARILDEYTTASGQTLDYRIAVTTTGRDVDYVIDPDIPPPFPDLPPIPQSEKGDNGEFRQDCGMSRRWIERSDPDAASTFSCVAKVGTGGPSLEMPLHSLELALSDRMADGTNQGFLRDDALLAFVVLTDEDDCSRTDNNFTVPNDQCDESLPEVVPTQHYVDMLDGLTGDRGRWATAVIAGPTSCESGFGSAIAAERLQQFVGETGDNAVFSSICEGDLASALRDALDTFEAACDSFPPIE